MLTSFGANVPVFWSESLLLFCKSPALHHSKPGFRGRKARLSSVFCSGSPVLQMTPTVYVIPITCPMLFRPLCDAQRIITN